MLSNAIKFLNSFQYSISCNFRKWHNFPNLASLNGWFGNQLNQKKFSHHQMNILRTHQRKVPFQRVRNT